MDLAKNSFSRDWHIGIETEYDKSMRVLFVTSEIATLYKRGGLGDVSYALPVALAKLGVHVAIAMPYYEKLKVQNVTGVGQLAMDYDRRRELIFVFQTFLGQTRVPVYLFRHPRLNEYDGDHISDTFAFFSKAVAELYRASVHVLSGPYDVIHCNDWHTALVPMLLGESNKLEEKETLNSTSAKTIITIHNLLYQGETGIGMALRLGVTKERFHRFDTPLGRAVRLLREGLEYADIITTVSPTYAKEISRGGSPSSTRTLLKKRKNDLVGILNGIDQTLWDPRHDKYLPMNYDRRTVTAGKLAVKRYLQKSLGLPDSPVPLFGFVGRLEERQKGTDLIARAVAHLDPSLFQLALLGTGHKKEVHRFENLAKKYKNIAFVHTFDERLARRMYAGSDFMLVPSRFEPCGLTQMIAMRYGTIPIVRRTGGLADTVVDGKTGFVFGPYTTRALVETMNRARDFYAGDKVKFDAMMERVMKKDFSWTASARKYKKLYQKLLTR